METRTVEQMKVYALVLNTFGSAESRELVALASSEEALKNWYEEQKLEKPKVINFVEDYGFRKYQKGYTQGKFDQKMEQLNELQEARKQAISDFEEFIDEEWKKFREEDEGEMPALWRVSIFMKGLLSKLSELE